MLYSIAAAAFLLYQSSRGQDPNQAAMERMRWEREVWLRSIPNRESEEVRKRREANALRAEYTDRLVELDVSIHEIAKLLVAGTTDYKTERRFKKALDAMREITKP